MRFFSISFLLLMPILREAERPPGVEGREDGAGGVGLSRVSATARPLLSCTTVRMVWITVDREAPVIRCESKRGNISQVSVKDSSLKIINTERERGRDHIMTCLTI